MAARADRMRELLAQGMTAGAAGRAMGLTPSQTEWLCRRHGLQASPEAVRTVSVANLARHNEKRMAAYHQRVERMREMVAAGATIVAAGRELGLSDKQAWRIGARWKSEARW